MEKNSTSLRSPLSPTLWPAEAFSASRVAIFISTVAGAFIAASLMALVAVRLDGSPALTATRGLRLTAGLLIAQIIVYVLVLAVALPLFPYAARRTLRQLGLHAPRAADVSAGLVGALGMYVCAELAALLQKFVFHIEGTQADVQLFGTTHDQRLIAGLVVVAVLLAPMFEELLFRGFLFNAMLRYLPVGGAALISGIVFGFAHGDRTALFPLACGGVVLAVVYYRTGSLVAAMFTHGFFNLANVIIVLAMGGKIT
ncbi:MAG: lysostaphin resistance A-like protein [Candidatus Velthaea sp.]